MGTMQFGLFGGARTRRGLGLEDSQGYESFIEYVTEADRLGFRQLFMVEHHFTGHGQVSASMTVLAYLAARTRNIRLGTAVVVLPWHNPALVAEQVATLDLLSGGRVDFGVGKGYRQAEFDGFCIPPAEATERFDEAMEIIRKAWTTDGRFSHHGKRWHYDNIVVEPEPMQRPHPPLWLAAGSPDSARRAKVTISCSTSSPRPIRSSAASPCSATSASARAVPTIRTWWRHRARY